MTTATLDRFGIALDRASVRSFDIDGRLHVESAHITRVQCAPYYGREIPGSEEAGWLPDQIYHLYRPAEELEKAAPSAAGIQLLDIHTPVNAQDHKPNEIAGAVGTEIKFNYPYVDAPLTVWTTDAIAAIEDGTQRELSAGYYYRLEVKSGQFEGQKYDGVMRDIVFNHVALVDRGRAGRTVMVGDSALPLTIPKTEETMSKQKPSMAAMLTRGAVMAVIVPKLAADQSIDAVKLTNGITAKNLAAKLPGILGAIKPKLAQDADFKAIQLAFDAVEEEAKKMEAEDEDPDMKPEGAEDEDDEDDEDEEKKKAKKAAEDAEADEKEKAMFKEKKEEKAAMDAALDAKVAKVAEALRAEARATREAISFVRPWVGELNAVACDSAVDVYKAAMGVMKLACDGVHPDAFKHIIAAQPKPGERKQTLAVDHALMATDTAAFKSRFPKSRAAH